jgi:hypothetical protein
LDQLYVDLWMADDVPDDAMHGVCDPELPEAGEIWMRLTWRANSAFTNATTTSFVLILRGDGGTPIETTSSWIVDINKYNWEKHCRGLFDLPIAA